MHMMYSRKKRSLRGYRILIFSHQKKELRKSASQYQQVRLIISDIPRRFSGKSYTCDEIFIDFGRTDHPSMFIYRVPKVVRWTTGGVS